MSHICAAWCGSHSLPVATEDLNGASATGEMNFNFYFVLM